MNSVPFFFFHDNPFSMSLFLSNYNLFKNKQTSIVMRICRNSPYTCLDYRAFMYVIQSNLIISNWLQSFECTMPCKLSKIVAVIKHVLEFFLNNIIYSLMCTLGI